MKTVSTKIKDFQVGDLFVYYGTIQRVTSDVRVWNDCPYRTEVTETPSVWHDRSCYGRKCEFVKPVDGDDSYKYYGGLITNYTWMQGIEEVTYAKIVNL